MGTAASTPTFPITGGGPLVQAVATVVRQTLLHTPSDLLSSSVDQRGVLRYGGVR